jgi:beta-phosphoglucomutase-like phosphatase (HAD superfamily)
MLALVALPLEDIVVEIAPWRSAALANARAAAGDDPVLLELAERRADQEVATRLAANGARVSPEAVAFVETCAVHAPVAVVTRFPRRAANAVLGLAGLADLVRVVISAEDAPPPPDPAGFRRAIARIERLGLPPAGVRYAIVATPAEAAAARAAGCRVAAVVDLAGLGAVGLASGAGATGPAPADATPGFVPDVLLPNFRDAFDVLRADALARAADP